MERLGHREGGEDLAQEPQDRGWGDRQGGARGPAGRGERSGPERGPGVGTHGGPQLPGDEVPWGVRRGWPRRDRLPPGSGQQARRSRHPILRGQLEVRGGRGSDGGLQPDGALAHGRQTRGRDGGLRPDWAERDGQGVRGQEARPILHGRGREGGVQGPRARAAGEGELLQRRGLQGRSNNLCVEPDQRTEVRKLAGRGLRGASPGLDRGDVRLCEASGPKPSGHGGRGGLLCRPWQQLRGPHREPLR
mmetsp:Transcript_1361/g.4261  ORF Transcript_1361/g.4261 Transcript_1361/m.4261 type:complete len:248 (-) Transcript_1361:3827-4570(-)